MLEKDAYTVVCDILKPESFYDPANQKIYAAIQTLGAAQQSIDMLTVTERLRLNGDLEGAGGALRISELTSKVASGAHVSFTPASWRRNISPASSYALPPQIEAQAFDESYDVDDLLQEAEGKLFEISQRNVKKDVTQIDPVINSAIEQIQIAANRASGLSGLESGYHEPRQTHLGMAAQRPHHHRGASRHGQDGLCALHGQKHGGQLLQHTRGHILA